VVTHEIGFACEVSTEIVFLADGQVDTRAPAANFLHNAAASPRLTAFLRRFRRQANLPA